MSENPAARFHPPTVRAALDVLHPDGGVIEARILKTRRGTVSGYFDDKAALVKAVAFYHGKHNIYVTLNTVPPDLMARSNNRLTEYADTTTSDKEIVTRRWFPIDLDPTHPKGISSTDAELAAAIAKRDAVVSYLYGNGWPEMFLAASGNGGHGLARCDFPNTPEIRDLFEQALKALAARFDDAQVKLDTGVFNAARIWKLYGTIACKGDPIVTRPHRLAVITSAPETPSLLTLEQVEWLAAQAPAPVARTYSAPSERRYQERDLLAEFQGRGLYLKALDAPKHAVTCPSQAEHSTDSGLSETCLFEPETPGAPWGFKCFHSHCSERTIKDVLALFGDGPVAGPSNPDTGTAIAPLTALEEGATLEAIESALRTVAAGLGGADGLRRAAVREAAVRILERLHISSPAKLVDAAFATPKNEGGTTGQGDAIFLPTPEPWPTPVDGARLLDDITRAVTRFVSLPKEAADAVALFAVNAHAHDAGDISPILCVNSAVKRSGKTTLLSVLSAFVPRHLFTSNITPAGIFRIVQEFKPTLLIDEADSFLALSDETRGLLNSGHNRKTAVIIRLVGDNHEPRAFSTWCPKAIALIGKLPDTLADRSIIVTMKRKGKGDKVERFRVRKLKELEPLCRQAARWAKDNLVALSLADPEVPDALDDRAADNWRPLLAIADLAGGDWPARARKAALALSSDDTRTDSEIGVLLLGDLRAIFEKRDVDRLASSEILKDLIALEERPWSDWRHGRPLTARHLAKLLEPFGIKPDVLWIGGTTVRGYGKDKMEDAFLRYLPPYPKDPKDLNNDGDLDNISLRKEPPHLTDTKQDLTVRQQTSLTDITDRNPLLGGNGDIGSHAESEEMLCL